MLQVVFFHVSKNTIFFSSFFYLFFFFLIFYFKTCSKDLNNADPAPKGNRFWKSQYSFKILRLINDI